MTARRALLIAYTCMVLGSCGPASPNPDGTNPGAGQGQGGSGAGGSNTPYSGTATGNNKPGTSGSNGTGTADLSLQIPAGQGYQSRAGNFMVSVQWTAGPNTAIANSCVLKFADHNRQRLKSFSLQSFIPWNYAIGQGSSTAPIPLSPNTLNATEVTASNFVLPYAGRWVLQISATTNGISDVADVPFFAN